MTPSDPLSAAPPRAGEPQTRSVNLRAEPYDVYIGRPSKWGNPFDLVTFTRAGCIAKYREWITHGDGRPLLYDLEELRGKRLGCYCKPLACHGDVLVELLAQAPPTRPAPDPTEEHDG